MKRYVRCSAVAMMALVTACGSAQTGNSATANCEFFSCLETHQRADLDRVQKMYSAALRHTNDGVVEAALAHVVRMKLYLPEREFSTLEKQIEALAESGKTQSIRYRAYLAGYVFDSPDLFSAERFAHYSDGEELFTAISNRLQNTLIGEHKQ